MDADLVCPLAVVKIVTERKQITRSSLLGDADYFATQLIRCLESLVKIEPVGHVRVVWQQAAALVRKVRGVIREAKDYRRRRLPGAA